MTNEEAIKKLKEYIEMLKEDGFSDLDVEEFEIAINSIQENTKLKSEIEQLKSELEQLKIPCIHGYDKTQNEIGETLIYCEHTDNWMNVTLGECIGNCEAEERPGVK